jgi:2-phosphoglycolate phosphatase
LKRPLAVLFDLDGTLVDSAPDLVDALNRVRVSLNRAPVPEAQVRPAVSKGGMAMLRAGIPEIPDAEHTLLERFLATYRENICVRSALFDGVAEVLAVLEAERIPWGIVTNKPEWLTTPLLAALALDTRIAALVCGDTLPVRKPDPAPVRHACEVIGVLPADTAMVGDDRRDIDSARGAGALAVIAAWGYIGADESPLEWAADRSATTPRDLLALFGLR